METSTNYSLAMITQRTAETLAEDGLRTPHTVMEPLLRLNTLLVRLPLDSIQKIDERADAQARTGALEFYNSLNIRNRNIVQLAFNQNFTNCMVLGLISGVSIGMTAAPAIGGLIAGGPGAFLGFVIGTTVSSLVGAVSGMIAACVQTTVLIKCDVSYQEWVAEQKLMLRYESYIEYIHAYNTNARELLCPISQDFPQIPVRSPNGHIYDKSSIEEYLDRKERSMQHTLMVMKNEGHSDEEIQQYHEELKTFICPFRGPYFTKDQLVYDRSFSLQMRRKLSAVIDEMALEERHKAIGMEILIASLKKTDNMIMAQKIALLYQKMGPLGLSVQQQAECIERVMNE